MLHQPPQRLRYGSAGHFFEDNAQGKGSPRKLLRRIFGGFLLTTADYVRRLVLLDSAGPRVFASMTMINDVALNICTLSRPLWRSRALPQSFHRTYSRSLRGIESISNPGPRCVVLVLSCSGGYRIGTFDISYQVSTYRYIVYISYVACFALHPLAFPCFRC